MIYPNTFQAEFIARPNRFIAVVSLNGRIINVHVRNTGRCREILIPGTKVFLIESNGPNRKTSYDLVAAYKGSMLINMDTLAPNRVFAEYIRESGFFGLEPIVHPERKHGDSRFDFYIESEGRRIFVEVKGVTLENNGVCRFPDAPTERGLKHLRGLERCVEDGYEAYVAFVVQMEGMRVFIPNYATHPEFGLELERAERKGVRVLVLGCRVTEDSLTVVNTIPHEYRGDHS